VAKDLSYDESQVEAISRCIDLSHENRIVPITGTAGTGKTSILEEVYNTLDASGIDVVLCAPTGKAAKRIKEVTDIDARTMHRLLEYPHPGELNPKTGKPYRSTDPKRDRQNPFDQRVVLADEYAMVNTEVHRNTLAALPRGGCIRMFGDANQLQPIESNKRLNEAPSPFMNILKQFNGIELKTIHRQSEGSVIISNGNRIIKGHIPVRDNNFILNITDQPVHAIQDFIMDNLDNGVDFTQTHNQVIAPTKVGWTGTDDLNPLIQGLVQSGSKYYIEPERHQWSKVTGMRLYVDDKVIQTTNNYDLGVFNGETGKIITLHDDGTITVDFGDRIMDIPPLLEVQGRNGMMEFNPQRDIDLAYAITTHKSQGSEYDEVCYIMSRYRSYLLNRKNLYTGVSRARRKVTIITDQRALTTSLSKKGDKKV